MKNNISKDSISVIVNHAENTTTVKIAGVKTPVSFVQSASWNSYLSALRDAAFYLLDKAATLDDGTPYNTRAQVVKMFEEHRTFNEKELV